MNDKDIAFRKMLLSLHSLRELEQQDRTMKELKDAAFEVLLETQAVTSATGETCLYADMRQSLRKHTAVTRRRYMQ